MPNGRLAIAEGRLSLDDTVLSFFPEDAPAEPSENLKAMRVRDLLAASMVFGVYSFLICLLWAGMGAVDVAFTEAAVGAGASAVFMIGTVYCTTRMSKDCPRRSAGPRSSSSR